MKKNDKTEGSIPFECDEGINGEKDVGQFLVDFGQRKNIWLFEVMFSIYIMQNDVIQIIYYYISGETKKIKIDGSSPTMMF